MFYRWGHYLPGNSSITLKDKLKDVLPLIRFPLMTSAEFGDKVVDLGLLSTDDVIELFKYLVAAPERKPNCTEWSKVPRGSVTNLEQEEESVALVNQDDMMDIKIEYGTSVEEEVEQDDPDDVQSMIDQDIIVTSSTSLAEPAAIEPTLAQISNNNFSGDEEQESTKVCDEKKQTFHDQTKTSDSNAESQTLKTNSKNVAISQTLNSNSTGNKSVIHSPNWDHFLEEAAKLISCRTLTGFFFQDQLGRKRTSHCIWDQEIPVIPEIFNSAK